MRKEGVTVTKDEANTQKDELAKTLQAFLIRALSGQTTATAGTEIEIAPAIAAILVSIYDTTY